MTTLISKKVLDNGLTRFQYDGWYEDKMVNESVEPTTAELEEAARQWRDNELAFTDWIIPLIDHPQREAHITYRESLRQWPSTDSFPETKPEL